MVGDRALNNEDTGKIGRGRIPRPARRLPWEGSFEDLGPAPLQAPPLPLHDVHSASEKGMVQPKARYRSFLRRKKRPTVSLL